MKKFPLAKASPFYPKQACDPEDNPLLRGGYFPLALHSLERDHRLVLKAVKAFSVWGDAETPCGGRKNMVRIRTNLTWHRKAAAWGHRNLPQVAVVSFPLSWPLFLSGTLCPACLLDSPCHKVLPIALFFISGSIIWLQPAVCYCDWRGCCGDAPFVENIFPTSCQTWVGKIVSIVCNLLFFIPSVIHS